MTDNYSKARWELLQVSIRDSQFTILDKLAKKRRIYHVPNLLHAELINQAVYIFTSSSKIMQLNLLTATRHFVSATEQQYLMEMQKNQKFFFIKDHVAKQLEHSLANIEKSVSASFSNTVNMH